MKIIFATLFVLLVKINFTWALEKLPVQKVVLKKGQAVSEMISFRIPNSWASFSVILSTEKPLSYLYLDSVLNAKNEVIVSNQQVNLVDLKIDQMHAPNLARPQQVSKNALQLEVIKGQSISNFPSNPSLVKIEPGLWSFQIAREVEEGVASENEIVKVEVFGQKNKVAAVIDSEVSIDLDLYVSPASKASRLLKLSVGQLASSKELKELVDFYAQYKIKIIFNSITQINSFSDEIILLQTGQPNDSPAFLEMLTLHKNKKSVPVFFLAPSEQLGKVGLSLGKAEGLLSDSKKIISTLIMRPHSLVDMPTVMAHELGHFFGLYHTNVDTLGDTVSWNHEYFGQEKVNPKARMNLMSEAGLDRARLDPKKFELSPSQIYIIKSSPAMNPTSLGN